MILKSIMSQPMHGYALASHIKQRSRDLLQVEEGSLYPALQRLLKENHVAAEWKLSATNRKIRVYTITSAGLKHLESEMGRFEQMLQGVSWVLSPA